MSSDLRAFSHRLRNVYWLGGGSGAGKSTIAERLARRYGLRRYSTDEAMSDHAQRSTPTECPLLAAFQTMSMDERWMSRTPETMFATFHWFWGEGFRFIVDDLLALPAGDPVIVEGFRLLPSLVKPLLVRADQSAWLLPTKEFRLQALTNRGSLWTIPLKTSDPDRALANILQRDALFTEELRQAAVRVELPIVEVDGALSEEALERRIAALFRFEISQTET